MENSASPNDTATNNLNMAISMQGMTGADTEQGRN